MEEVSASQEEQSVTMLDGTGNVNSNSEVERNKIRENMLCRLSQTDAHFKHQQRDEPDLSCHDKVDIASEILDRGVTTFLARFGSYLTADDLEYFKDKSDGYEIQFYLAQIKKEHSKIYSANLVKNRRYEAMKQLMMEGEYFSDDAMKRRDPYLYEQLIGQYLTQEEIQDQVDKADLRFSTILLKHMDQIEENQVYRVQKDKEDSQMEEEDEDTDDEEEEEMENDKDEEEVSDEKKLEMKDEFYRIMQERFLSGQDKQFDYSQVDKNTAYDNLDLLDKDEEEKYFDSEEPEESSVPKITQLAHSMLIDRDSDHHSSAGEKSGLGCDMNSSSPTTSSSATEMIKTDVADQSSEENVT